MLYVTKNKQPQMIPISSSLELILREYLKFRGGEPNDYLFPTRNNKKLSERGLYTAISNFNLKRDVSKTSCQLFRPTFARKYLKNGGFIQNLQTLMGHSRIEVTRGYLDPSLDDLKENYDSLNPLDKLKYENFGKPIKFQ